MCSQTADNLLRIFFPPHRDIDRLVHVGIDHNDAPGSLAACSRLLRQADYNVLSALSRRRTNSKTTWEVLLKDATRDKTKRKVSKTGSGAVQEAEPAGASSDAEPQSSKTGRGAVGEKEGIYGEAQEQEKFEELSRRMTEAAATLQQQDGEARERRREDAKAREACERLRRDDADPAGAARRREAAAAAVEDVEPHLHQFGIIRPRHSWLGKPRQAGADKRLIRFNAYQACDLSRPDEWKQDARRDLKEQMRRLGTDFGETDSRNHLRILRAVEYRLGADNPRVFLSYPTRAKYIGSRAREALEAEGFPVIEYQEPNAERIADEVLERIEQADCFIGLWHHDELEGDHAARYRLSPWMHFELGMAWALGKPWTVVRSSRLDAREWNRIITEVAIPPYDDVEFSTKTLPHIINYAKRHFRGEVRD